MSQQLDPIDTIATRAFEGYVVRKDLVRRFKAAKQFKSLAAMKLIDPSYPMHYRLLGQAKSRLIHLKPNPDGLTQLRGFIYDFEISMPIPLMEFCYYAGFGEFTYLGFGFVEIK